MADHMTADEVRAVIERIEQYARDKLDVVEDIAQAGHAIISIANSLKCLAAHLSGMAADWTHVDAVEPPHNTRNESFGTEYLVHPSQPGERTAFYGRRLGGKAQWYRHGAPVTGVTHYRPIPAAPEPPMSEQAEQLASRMAETWAFKIPPEDVARIIRGVARTASRPYLSQPAWSAVSDVFALGSTFAAALCRRSGIDPAAKLREVRRG